MTRSRSSTTVKSVFIFVTLSLLLIVATSRMASAAVLHKRSIVRRDQQTNQVSACESNSICGWEVYDPYTRNLEYYVTNSCKCTADETCIQVDDDLAISAYVYRCRVVPARKNRNKNKSTGRPNSPPAPAP